MADSSFCLAFASFGLLTTLSDFIYAHKRPFALFNGQNKRAEV